jgi:predicted acylesterase/phospholipase RssA
MAYKILAFGGGGSKGILHAGAIKYLEEKNLTNVEEIYGCSVGSMYATCLAFGLTAKQIEKMSSKFKSFSETFFGSLSLKELTETLTRKGLFEMDLLETFLSEVFLEETGIDLREKKISDALIPLRICSTNITKQQLTIFQGNFPVMKAVRASSCIPLIFCPQEINGSLYIDGGYLTNSMLDFIPKEKHHKTLEISIRFDAIHLSPQYVKSIYYHEYLYSLYKISCIYERKLKKHDNDIQLYYKLASGISDVSEKQHKEMISQGYELTRRFFSQRSF